MTVRDQERSDFLLDKMCVSFDEFMAEHAQVSEPGLSFRDELERGHAGEYWRIFRDCEKAYNIHLADNTMSVSEAIERGILDENGERSKC